MYREERKVRLVGLESGAYPCQAGMRLYFVCSGSW